LSQTTLTQPNARSTKRRRIRLMVRIVCLIAAILCLWPVHASLPPIVGAMSPFVAIASLIATRTLHTILILGLIVALVALFRHRFFCRWMCPTGLCMDTASALGRKLKRKPSHGNILAAWLLVATLIGAFLGLPLFLWLDPLALFSGLFSVAASPRSAAAWIGALIFIALLIACILSPRLWCGCLCPLGALQDLLAKLPRIGRRRSKDKTRPDYLTRRTVLSTILAFGSTALMVAAVRNRFRRLRPPGAIDDSTFATLCTSGGRRRIRGLRRGGKDAYRWWGSPCGPRAWRRAGRGRVRRWGRLRCSACNPGGSNLFRM